MARCSYPSDGKRKCVQYALLVKPHANTRYTQSLQKLAIAELQCLLAAWDVTAEPSWTEIAGTPFVTFEAEELSPLAWQAVSGHSALCFASVREGIFLRPIPLTNRRYLPDDLPEVLKYKGKTNADFTSMMLHCACAASDFARSQEPLTVLDPLCGRGTTLFCALESGHHGIGVDLDAKAVAEADAYFSRYLQYHHIKHERHRASATLDQGHSAPEFRYSFANTLESYRQGRRRTLRLFVGDTRKADRMAGKENCHLLLADLPYGVQHAPKQGKQVSSFGDLLQEALPAYRAALKPGGAMALSFNLYTLSRNEVVHMMQSAGFTVQIHSPYHDFSHWVEQAVHRDFVVARKEKPSTADR